MRSSKSRSRSKQNRPRTIGNIINRVFDSSGPEGKVRGTPQQIIEKYQALARDAQLSNDRVAAENFLQHAEHYTRMLGEAMREMAAEQETRRQHQGGNGNGNGHHGNGHQGERSHQGGERPWQQRRDDRGSEEQPEVGPVPVFPFEDSDVLGGGSDLVDTPEDRLEAVVPMSSDEPQPAIEAAAPRREERGDRRGEPRKRDENRREGRRDENRRDDNRRDENRRDENRRDENKRDNRRKDERREGGERRPARQPMAEPVAAVALAEPPVAELVAEVAVAAEVPAAEAPVKKPRRAPAAPRKPKAAPAAEAPVSDAE